MLRATVVRERSAISAVFVPIIAALCASWTIFFALRRLFVTVGKHHFATPGPDSSRGSSAHPCSQIAVTA